MPGVPGNIERSTVERCLKSSLHHQKLTDVYRYAKKMQKGTRRSATR